MNLRTKEGCVSSARLHPSDSGAVQERSGYDVPDLTSSLRFSTSQRGPEIRSRFNNRQHVGFGFPRPTCRGQAALQVSAEAVQPGAVEGKRPLSVDGMIDRGEVGSVSAAVIQQGPNMGSV